MDRPNIFDTIDEALLRAQIADNARECEFLVELLDLVQARKAAVGQLPRDNIYVPEDSQPRQKDGDRGAGQSADHSNSLLAANYVRGPASPRSIRCPATGFRVSERLGRVDSARVRDATRAAGSEVKLATAAGELMHTCVSESARGGSIRREHT